MTMARRLMLLFCLACCLAPIPAVADPPAKEEPLLEAPAPQMGERVVHLPEDGQTWYTVAIVNAQRTQLDQQFLAGFDVESRLRSLKAQTRFFVYGTDHPIYQQRFAQHVKRMPAVFVLRGDSGEVVYTNSGPEIATHPHDLGEAIQCAIKRRCPHGRCQPVVEPIPEPTPQPEPPVGPPDVGPPLPPADTSPPAWQLFVLGLAAACTTWVVSLKHDING